MKECSKCFAIKSKLEFYSNKKNEDGLQPTCKTCCKKATTNYIRKKKTGCSPTKYDALYVKQAGCCVICGTHSSKLSKGLAADHCHTSGKIRGLLCATCNLGIGCFKDSVTILKSAVEYLERN